MSVHMVLANTIHHGSYGWLSIFLVKPEWAWDFYGDSSVTIV